MPDDIGLELASMDDDCSGCGLNGAPTGANIHPDRSQPHLYLDHEACKGTGRVPRFKGVRVPCVVGHYDGFGEGWHGTLPDVHQDSECPGWTVSDRLEDWLDYLPNGWGLHRIDRTLVPWEVWNNISESMALGGTPLQALQQALLKATT